MHLKWSNGSKQELHLYIDLQAVEAKKLISLISDTFSPLNIAKSAMQNIISTV